MEVFITVNIRTWVQYPCAPMTGKSSESMSEETLAMPRVRRQE